MRSTTTIKRLVASALFCVGLVAMITALDYVLTPFRGTTDPWPAVAATRGEADVIALGSSRTQCAILPMEMWRAQGITALDVAGQVQPYSVTTAYLEQVLTEQRPKVVMLDLYMCGKETPFSLVRAHTSLDRMPAGIPRTMAILGSIDATGWFEAFVPLQTYHSRWAELTQRDFQLRKATRDDYARGAKYLPAVASMPATAAYEQVVESAYVRDLGYVRRMARMCADSGAAFVVFSTPTRWQQRVDGRPLMSRLEADLKAEYPEVRFLDMSSVAASIGIDPALDYADELHLNHRGAVKVSVWLGRDLARTYGLQDRRGEALAAGWNEALRRYDAVFKPMR
jgi:hypothetical protein